MLGCECRYTFITELKARCTYGISDGKDPGIENTYDIAAVSLCEDLSFIGLGVQPPIPEWGAMLSNGKDFLRHNAYITIFPGLRGPREDP